MNKVTKKITIVFFATITTLLAVTGLYFAIYVDLTSGGVILTSSLFVGFFLWCVYEVLDN